MKRKFVCFCRSWSNRIFKWPTWAGSTGGVCNTCSYSSAAKVRAQAPAQSAIELPLPHERQTPRVFISALLRAFVGPHGYFGQANQLTGPATGVVAGFVVQRGAVVYDSAREPAHIVAGDVAAVDPRGRAGRRPLVVFLRRHQIVQRLRSRRNHGRDQFFFSPGGAFGFEKAPEPHGARAWHPRAARHGAGSWQSGFHYAPGFFRRHHRRFVGGCFYRAEQTHPRFRHAAAAADDQFCGAVRRFSDHRACDALLAGRYARCTRAAAGAGLALALAAGWPVHPAPVLPGAGGDAQTDGFYRQFDHESRTGVRRFVRRADFSGGQSDDQRVLSGCGDYYRGGV